MATRQGQLYEDEFYAWTRDQAQALCRLAAEHWNGPLDLERLAEEVEGLGSEQQWAVESRLERVLEHLLKLGHSASGDPRRQWMISIVDRRGELERRMTATNPHRGRACPRQAVSAGAAQGGAGSCSPRREGGGTGAAGDCLYAFDDVVANEWWPANRHGLRDDD